MSWLRQNTLIAAALAAIVLLICRFKQIGPAARHVLWLVVLVKLVTPPLVFWPWPVPRFSETSNIHRPLEDGPPGARVDADVPAPADLNVPNESNVVVSNEWLVVPVEDIGKLDSPAMRQQSQDRQGERPLSSVGASAVPWWEEIPWRTATGLVWLIGSVLVLLVNLNRIVRMQRRVGRAAPAAAWLNREVQYWAKQMGVRPPEVVSVDSVSSPMLWAPFRPRLLWPEALSAETDADAWRGVIVHELAHIKRKDHWVGWVELLARCLWWWNPLFWCVRHQVRENAELACDAWVVETLPDGRRAYAEVLLTVCENLSQTATLPAIGIGSGARRNLERRLTMILKERVPFQVPRFAMFAVVVLGLLTLPAWTQSKPQNTEPETAATPNANQFSSNGTKADDTSATLPADEAKPTASFGESTADGSPIRRGNRNRTATRPAKSRRLTAGSPFGSEPAATPASNRSRNTVPSYGSPVKRTAGTVGSSKKVQVLEQQLRQLQRDINKLRYRDPRINTHTDESGFGPGIAQNTQGEEALAPIVVRNPNFINGVLAANGRIVETRTITLQRTTYRLPNERSKALETFLKQHIKAEVLTISIDLGKNTSHDAYHSRHEDTITITTTPEVQRVIGGLILIMRKDAPKKPPMDAAEVGGQEEPSARFQDEGQPRLRQPRRSTNRSSFGGDFGSSKSSSKNAFATDSEPPSLPTTDSKAPSKSSAKKKRN